MDESGREARSRPLALISLLSDQVSTTETDRMFFLGRRLPWAVILV